MGKFIRLFKTEEDYQREKESLPTPCVSWVENGKVYYKPYIMGQIAFADANVKSILLDNFDYNGDGVITEEEALRVNTFGTIFKEKSNIDTFNDGEYFKNITNLDHAFYGSSLSSIKLKSEYKGGIDCINMLRRMNSLTSAKVILKATRLSGAFADNPVLKSLDLSGIDVSSCDNFNSFTSSDKKLSNMIIDGWNLNTGIINQSQFFLLPGVGSDYSNITISAKGCSDTTIAFIQNMVKKNQSGYWKTINIIGDTKTYTWAGGGTYRWDSIAGE